MSASARRTEATERVELPPDETGPVPISVMRTEPHWFGVTPPLFVLGIALVVIVVAIALFASGSWPVGLILFGVGTMLLAVYVEAARRRRHSFVARVSADVRGRAGSTWKSLRVRSFVAMETRRIRGDLILLRSQRRDLLLALGAATYGGHQDAAREANERLRELHVREAELNAALDAKLAEAGERIRRAKLSVEKTMRVPPPAS
jgi:ABC-type multidrug transport system fused ATPase/permease subunit